MAGPFQPPPGGASSDPLASPVTYEDPSMLADLHDRTPAGPSATETFLHEVVRDVLDKKGFKYSDTDVWKFVDGIKDNPSVIQQANIALQARSLYGSTTKGEVPTIVNAVLGSTTQDDDLNQFGLGIVQSLGGHLSAPQKKLVEGDKPPTLRDYEIAQGIDPDLNEVNSGLTGMFESYFSRKPRAAEMNAILANSSDAQSAEDYLRSLPSHVPGLNMGTYTDLRKSTDAAVQKTFGHTAADSVITSLVNEGITSPAGIASWVEAQSWRPAKDVEPSLYAAAYQAHVPHAQNVFNDVPDFRDVGATIASAGVQATPTTTEQMQQQAQEPTLQDLRPDQPSPWKPGPIMPQGVEQIPPPPGGKS